MTLLRRVGARAPSLAPETNKRTQRGGLDCATFVRLVHLDVVRYPSAAMSYDDDILRYPDIDEYDDEGLGIVYPISIFFALGIWLVFQRYQSMRNRAVPFRVRAPEVRFVI